MRWLGEAEPSSAQPLPRTGGLLPPLEQRAENGTRPWEAQDDSVHQNWETPSLERKTRRRWKRSAVALCRTGEAGPRLPGRKDVLHFTCVVFSCGDPKDLFCVEEIHFEPNLYGESPAKEMKLLSWPPARGAPGALAVRWLLAILVFPLSAAQ